MARQTTTYNFASPTRPPFRSRLIIVRNLIQRFIVADGQVHHSQPSATASGAEEIKRPNSQIKALSDGSIRISQQISKGLGPRLSHRALNIRVEDFLFLADETLHHPIFVGRVQRPGPP